MKGVEGRLLWAPPWIPLPPPTSPYLPMPRPTSLYFPPWHRQRRAPRIGAIDGGFFKKWKVVGSSLVLHGASGGDGVTVFEGLGGADVGSSLILHWAIGGGGVTVFRGGGL